MPTVKRLTDQMVDPWNDTLAFYIPEASVPSALAGDIPNLDRYFILKVNKHLRDYTMSISEFASLRASIASENKKITEGVKLKMPSYMKEVSQNLSKEFDIDLALDIAQMIPLDLHYDEAGAFAYSMFMNYGIQTDSQHTPVVVSGTATSVNLSGSVIFLYAYGDKDDLDWTRSSSEAWHKFILSINAPHSQESLLRGIDWDKVGAMAIGGVIIGGLAALIGAILSKRRKNGA